MSVAAPISAVIPAHNSAEFIGEAIASVKSQTLAIAELIVVADACSDDTSELARSLGAFVIEGNHRNISASRNLGIRRATYE
jgi:glycosyltransferase involved in cell wall biosynthesis